MATLAARLAAFAQAVGADIKALQAALAGAGGGGGEPWTRVKLADDFTSNNSFSDIPGLTFTPPADSDFMVEADLLVLTTTAANVPRIGVSIPAGCQWAAADIKQAGATATTQVQANGGTLTTATLVQMAAGGLPAANSPRVCSVLVKGRSGASPSPITLQLAAESGGPNTVFVKAGSEMRHRLVA